MKRLQREGESRFLDRVLRYRDEYRKRCAAELREERVRRHAQDEVYVVGCWIPRTDAERIVRGFQKREHLIFAEIIVLLILLLALAGGLWSLFGFLFLP